MRVDRMKCPFLITCFIMVVQGRQVSRAVDENASTVQTETDIVSSRPILSSDRLHEIRLYDRMKCFPKVLCTLTKSQAFTKLGSINLNDLADGYLRLLTAFPGGPPSNLNDEGDEKPTNFKDDLNPPLSEIEDPTKDDQFGYMPVKNNDESEELPLSDPLSHYKEKLEMKKLMDELLAEERLDASKKPSRWSNAAISLPLKMGGTLLKSVVLPYLMGKDRRKRGAIFKKRGRNSQSSLKDPILSAMKRWNKLLNATQCSRVYPTCPFESFEIVSLIKLVKDSSRRKS